MLYRKAIIIFVILFIATGAYALRISRPPILIHPLSEDQITQLNRYLEDVWNMTQGRYEADIVTSTKTNANNGEMWLIDTAGVVRIQYKAANHIFTVTADGF